MRAGRAIGVAMCGALVSCAGKGDTPDACHLAARPLTTAVGFDANSDGVVDVADGAWLLARNFRDGADPPCLDAVEAFGDRVTDSGTAYAVWYSLISGTAQPTLAAGTCARADDVPAACGDGLALSVDAPADASGAAGSTTSVTATVRLVSPALPVEAWSISLEAAGCTVASVTTAGTIAADLRDDPPGERDGGLAMAQASTTGGAVSLVVLDPIGGATVSPASAAAVLSVQLDVPIGSACGTCAISLADGQVGRGRPLTNTVSSGGRSYAPEATGASIRACPG